VGSSTLAFEGNGEEVTDAEAELAPLPPSEDGARNGRWPLNNGKRKTCRPGDVVVDPDTGAEETRGRKGNIAGAVAGMDTAGAGVGV
jgi:hypothetical protein